MSAKNGQNGSGFIFATAAAALVIYWVYEVRKMSGPAEKQKMAISLDADQRRDWFYDLIKNNDDAMVFVAEVPGPEEKINVQLSAGILKIKGGQNFSKAVQIEMPSQSSSSSSSPPPPSSSSPSSSSSSSSATAAENMGISEYKYRNGVLTVKIQKMV
jgi:HSP20 family molecular chaperone IbpA